MTEPSVGAIVLAGGRSTRFGGDKLAAIIEGRPLLHRALDAVAAVADEVVLVLAADGPPPALPEGLGVPVAVTRDRVAGRGPLAGLAAGLAAASAPVTLLVAGDQPFLHPDVLRALVAELGADVGTDAPDVAALADRDWLWPFPVALRVRTVRPAVEASLGGSDLRLFTLFRGLRVVLVPEVRWRSLDPAGASLRDVDTPDDLPPP